MRMLICLGFLPGSLSLEKDSIDIVIYDPESGVSSTKAMYSALIQAENIIDFLNSITLNHAGRQRQLVLPQLRLNFDKLTENTAFFFRKTSIEQMTNASYPLALFLPIILIIKESRYDIAAIYKNIDTLTSFAENFFNGNYLLDDKKVMKMINSPTWSVDFCYEPRNIYT